MRNLIAKVPSINSYTKHGNDEWLDRRSQDFHLDSVCRTIYWKKKIEKSRILLARFLDTVITVLCEV